MEPGFIGIIGGAGRMGSLMARLFVEAGHEVLSIDADSPDRDWARLAECKVIILAVPIGCLGEVLKRVGRRTDPHGVVIDICSLKEEPVRMMLDHCRGEVIGAHPLFGPGVSSLKDQTIFFHPARGDFWLDWFKSFFTKLGSRLVEMDPARHDRLMARVQVLRHVLLFSFGQCLARLNFDLETDLAHSGPWFSGLVEMLQGQLGQAPELYADLALNNPAAPEVMREFVRASVETGMAFSGSDKSRIVELISGLGR